MRRCPQQIKGLRCTRKRQVTLELFFKNQAVPKNMSNEEYIAVLQQQNAVKKQREMSAERVMEKRVQQREQGFNLYTKGANVERIRDQQTKKIMKPKENSQTRDNSKGARRQWRVEDKQDEQPQTQVYQNPVNDCQFIVQFEISGNGIVLANPSKRPQNQQQRKRWGQDNGGDQQVNFLDQSSSPDSREVRTVQEVDESYSDDGFEEVNKTVDQTNRQQDVADLLKTATAEQLDVLKQSLSNFKQIKNEDIKNLDDEYIEEVFEADMKDEESADTPSVLEQSIVELTEEEMVRLRQEEEKNRQLEREKIVGVVRGKADAKVTRPISATYDLSKQFQSKQNLHAAQSQKQLPFDYQKVGMVAMDVKKSAQTNRPGNQSTTVLQCVAETPQSHLNPKQTPLNMNPFKQRPVSHMVLPKRETTAASSTIESQGSKVNYQTSNSNQFVKPQSQDPISSSRFKNEKLQKVQPKELAIEDLLHKIYQLDDTQRHQLFMVLKDLESTGSLTGNQLNQGLQKFLSPEIALKQQQPAKQQHQPQHSISSTSTIQQLKSQAKAYSHNELIIRVISTLGNPHVCGLTEIELFDSNAVKMMVAPACILIRNLGKGPKIAAEKLINGQKLTNNERHMWVGYLPPPQQNLEIVIYYSRDIEIGGLKLWNYNKGIIDCTKGVQKVQLLVNSTFKWEGRLEPGKGNINIDYSKQIVLTQKMGFSLPLEIQPKLEPEPLKLQPMVKIEDQAKAIPEQDYSKKDKSSLWFEPTAPKPKMDEIKSQMQKRSRQESPPQSKIRDARAAIANAVNSVNKVLGSHNKGVVDESLDSLDFFKVTNLGRLQNVENKVVNKWNAEQSTMSKDSQARKAHQGPQIAKSSLPDDFVIPSPSMHQSRKATGAKPQRSEYSENLSNFNDLNSIQIKQPAKIQQKQNNPVLSIPTLPSGQILKFNILKTWGDMNYLGLTGIEVFDQQGQQVKIYQISACPPDINILPDYGDDPRTVDKLVDGQYFTNDDLHVWLTPFTSGEDHTITIDFGKQIKISMIRIWNYNKSRIHSYRGARLITAELDKTLIFNGEIKKAPGTAKDPESCCEIILFTDSEQILKMIDMNDWLNEHEIANFDQTQRLNESFDIKEERPMTATKKFSATEIEDLQFQLQQQASKPTSLFDERPQTSAIIQSQRIGQPPTGINTTRSGQRDDWQQQKPAAKNNHTISGRKIWINITESWGDLFYVGLNGIEILNSMGEPIPVTVSPEPFLNSNTVVKAVPRDMNSIPGHGQDHRTLEKLFNDKNNTTDDRNMWLIPFNKGENHTILIDLGEVRNIQAIKFYNYNKSIEDSLRGARQVIIKIDDVYMTPKKGITLRKSPGQMVPGLDIGQFVSMPFRNGWTNDQIIPVQKSISQNNQQDGIVYQEYDAIGMPVGFIFTFNFYSTHGDLYYLGLNGVQLYDQNGKPLLITGQKMCAQPSDIRQLPGMQNDVRTCDKLINGKNDASDDSNMWLAPFRNTKSHSSEKEAKRDPNFVSFFFDRPTAVSAVQIWNYTKTPSRGVHEFEIEVDGNKVFRGYLKMGGPSAVLFSLEGHHADKLVSQINFNPSKRQNVLLMNECKILGEAQKVLTKEKFVFDEMARPQTKAINNFM